MTTSRPSRRPSLRAGVKLVAVMLLLGVALGVGAWWTLAMLWDAVRGGVPVLPG